MKNATKQKRFLVSGSGGLIGRKVVKKLVQKGHIVQSIGRMAPGQGKHIASKISFDNLPRYTWSQIITEKRIPKKIDGIIHLSGRPLHSQRWNNNHLNEVKQSRIEPLFVLSRAIKSMNPEDRPKTLVIASGAGYYPSSSTSYFQTLFEKKKKGFDETFKEPASNFLGRLSDHQEKVAKREMPKEMRIVAARFGVVLGHGGALKELLPLFKRGLGLKIGTGEQYFPWIHQNDAAGIIELALENDQIQGPINVVSGDPITNGEFTQTLCEILRKPHYSFLRIPENFLRLFMGNGYWTLTEGQPVIPEIAKKYGYQWEFENLKNALENVINSSQESSDILDQSVGLAKEV